MSDDLRSMLRSLPVPLIAAPMLRVSGIELVSAVCHSGVIGAFPTVNARTIDRLEEWLSTADRLQANGSASYCPNLIIKSPNLLEHLELICEHDVRLVITSVGSPAPVIEPLHAAGTFVLADVASIEHAKRAAQSGADGLVLLTAGAGGQTGWLNPFAFVAAVREFFDGVLVVAGGMSDGRSIAAAELAGYDAGYMGTRFIASTESLAPQGYRDMLCGSTMDDVLLTRAFTGLQTNMLRPSILAAGLDPQRLDEAMSPDLAGRLFGQAADGPKRWEDVWSAGHTVSAVGHSSSAAEVIATVRREYDEARAEITKR